MLRVNSDVTTANIVVGLAWGDEGKGKIVSAMAANTSYDYVCRFNGGPNAGHTVYVDGKKYKTHIIPSGVFHGIPSVIGPGCVINPTKFFEELDYLKSNGFDTSLVKISPNAHIITDEHITYDKNFLSHLGTTGQGIAPCYADKMLRKGIRAKDFFDSKYLFTDRLSGLVLAEGAQSVWLDVDHGNYPYVTSSSTLPYYACSLGFSPKDIHRIFGVAKMYDTKSGVDPDFPISLFDDPILSKIGELGGEVGTTTGRRRLVNYLNVDKLIDAANLAGVDQIIINKGDILDRVAEETGLNPYKYYFDGQLIECKSLKDLESDVSTLLFDGILSFDYQGVIFSKHPEHFDDGDCHV